MAAVCDTSITIVTHRAIVFYPILSANHSCVVFVSCLQALNQAVILSSYNYLKVCIVYCVTSESMRSLHKL
jgi:hypothetical protein